MEDNATQTAFKAKLFAYYEKYMLAVGILGQLLFFMQGFKIFLNQSAKDVSIVGFTIGLIAVTSWTIYGWLIKNKVVFIGNLVAVIGALFVLAGIMIYGG